MGHTPGPWLVTDEDQYDVLVEAPFEGILIARCERLAADDPTDANARLIAAAPDLLKTAKDALRLLDAAPIVGKEDYTEPLRAAIAEAEGAEVST